MSPFPPLTSMPDSLGRAARQLILLTLALIALLAGTSRAQGKLCLLSCPADLTAPCDTPNGATVSFNEPILSGDCVKGAQVQCQPPSGSFFPLGTTTVQCTATGPDGKVVATCAFTVTVNCAPPTTCSLTCPPDQVVDCTIPAGATVVFPLPTLGADCPKGAHVECNPASGSVFPVGLSIVACKVLDLGGQLLVDCKFTVTVKCAPPTTCSLICPPDQVVDCATSAGATVVFPLPTLGADCPKGAQVECNPASGSVFPVGLSIVMCKALDLGGQLVAECKFTVTVSAGPALQVKCRSDFVLDCAGTNGTSFKYDVSTAGGCGAITVECSPPSGSLFPVGLTIVRCVAKDASGKVAECKFTVTVRDNCQSDSSCLKFLRPPNIVVPCEQPEGAVVNYATPGGQNRCTGQPLDWKCFPLPGLFQRGTTLVRCWGPLLDSGEAAYCEFTVTVSGTCPTPPGSCISSECPPDKTIPCEGLNGTVVHYLFSAKNNCGQPMITICTPPSGSQFAPGVTEVICKAIAGGQVVECRFHITVVGDCTPRGVLTPITHNGGTTGPELQFSWPDDSGRYTVQTASALGNDSAWQLATQPVEHAGGVNRIIIIADPSSSGFYRLAQSLNERPIVSKPILTTVDPTRARPEQIMLKFHEGTGIRLRDGRLQFDPARLTPRSHHLLRRVSLTETQVADDVISVQALLAATSDTTLLRAFQDQDEANLSEKKRQGESLSGDELADLDLYYYLARPTPTGDGAAAAAEASILINHLNALASVEIAYATPVVMVPDLPPRTDINLVANQGYLNRAPVGIDARYAWTYPGGRGDGVRVVDVEGNWHLDHEDLPGPPFFVGGLPGNYTVNNLAEHGTAVLGVMVAQDNEFGVTGIASRASYGVSSFVTARLERTLLFGIPAAILNAVDILRAGDVMVIEAHSPGPRTGQICLTNSPNFCNCGQFEFVPQEFFQADWDAIQTAASHGIIVVEAAGNGSMNLDNPIYGSVFSHTPPVGQRGRTRAILVGASNGRGDLRTACFSNFGSGVDANGWGNSVATLGYGVRRANGDDARQWYELNFSGTSSASPIVAGAVLSIQGARRARGLAPLGPDEMRTLLQSTGSPQPSTETKFIGQQPNLRAALHTFLEQDAQFIGSSVPTEMTVNQRIVVTIVMRNIGHTTWRETDPNGLRHALSSQNPDNNTIWLDHDRVALPRATVAPGEDAEFHFEIQAPAVPGVYNFQWRMVQDFVEWFGDQSPNVSIFVGAPPSFHQLGGDTRLTGNPAVGANRDGRLEVFAHGLNNQLLHLHQLTPGGDYSGWEALSDNGVFNNGGTFAVARNSDDRLEVFGRLLSDHSGHLWQTTPNAVRRSEWSGLERFSGIIDPQFPFGEPTLAANSDGRLEVFGTNPSGELVHRWQLFPGGIWGLWFGLGAGTSGLPNGAPTVLRGFDGRLHVFVRGAGAPGSVFGGIDHLAQRTPNGEWTAWESLGGNSTDDPAVAQNADGRLEVMIRWADGSVHRRAQDSDGNWESAWTPLGSFTQGKPALLANRDGRLDALVATSDSTVQHLAQSAPNGPWGTWESLGGTGVHGTPAAGLNADGTLEVYVKAGGDTLWSRRQAAPGRWR